MKHSGLWIVSDSDGNKSNSNVYSSVALKHLIQVVNGVRESRTVGLDDQR